MNIWTHSTHTRRARVGALAVVACLATFRMGSLIAQAVPTDSITPTECGAGSYLECGIQTIQRCQEDDLPTPLNFGPMGGYRFQRPVQCEIISRRPIFKNVAYLR
jgi:hypothetical protein